MFPKNSDAIQTPRINIESEIMHKRLEEASMQLDGLEARLLPVLKEENTLAHGAGMDEPLRAITNSPLGRSLSAANERIERISARLAAIIQRLEV